MILRPAFTLGGTGGGFADNPEEMKERYADAPVTRAQLAALFCRFAGAGGADPSSLDPFPDRAAVPGWAEAPLAWAVEQELIKGTRVDGRLYLQPTGQATRAQFVTIMQRYLSTATKEETQ